MRSGICVAVRDVKTKIWMMNHDAIGMELEVNLPGHKCLGQSLLFLSDSSGIQTSKVIAYKRPDRGIVDTYGLVWAASPC